MPKINWDGRSAGNGTWVYEGNELKPKYGATTHNTFEFDGGVLKPKTGANSSNTFEFDGKKIKPKYGANSSNTYDINKAPIAVIIGQVCLKLW